MAEPKLVGWGWAAGHGQYGKNLWVNYKLQLQDFNKLFEAQGGKCAGCLAEFAHPLLKQMKVGIRCEVDHCHKTGKVRGLLCRGCNDFLGKIRDDADRIKRLEQYLRRNGEELKDEAAAKK